MTPADASPDRSLADPLPQDPMPTLRLWLDEAIAKGTQPNPTAMTLATVDPDGKPSARLVICRGFDLERGWFVFYTDRSSPKGLALDAHPYAALVFHWDALQRQIRIKGPATLSPEAESDSYFASRPIEAQIAAWSSNQSEPIDSREALEQRIRETAARHGVRPDDEKPTPLPRPPRWGGYRVWAERIELWVGQPGRVHDRGLWERKLSSAVDGWIGGPWSVRRLQP